MIIIIKPSATLKNGHDIAIPSMQVTLGNISDISKHFSEFWQHDSRSFQSLCPLIYGHSKIHVTSKLIICFFYRFGHLKLNTMRYLFPAIGSGIFLAITRQSPKVELGNIKPLALYCIIGTISALAIFVSVVYIPLATTHAIFLCSGLIVTLIAFGCFIGNSQLWIEVRR